MLSYFKTIDGRIRAVPEWEPGCWINCIMPTEDEINGLIHDFSIEPDFFRAAMDEEESSHIDTEDYSTLAIIDMPVIETTGSHVTYITTPLGIIITEKNVITVCTRENPVIDEFTDGVVKGVQTNLKTRFILHLMLRIATKYLQYLKQIDKLSSHVERELRKSMKNSELIQLLDIEKSLVYFSSSLKGSEITIEKISRGRVIKLYEDDQDLLEDVLIEVRQAIEMSSIYLNILSGTMDAFASVISNNLNIVMKVLSCITIVMAVPTIVSSFYGMNVNTRGMPFADSPFGFLIVLGLAILLSLVVAYIFNKKDLF